MNQFHFNNLIKNNLSKFIDYFHLSLNSDNIKYYGNCPIHDNSDNPQALLLYKNSGIWMCLTHHCEQKYNRYPFGFIQGLLAAHGQEHTDLATKNFITSILNKEIATLKSQPKKQVNYDRRNFIRQSKIFSNRVTRDYSWVLKYLKVPSDYFLTRGFSADILTKYMVGTFVKPNHDLHNRSVIPIFDNYSQKIIGYSSRSEYSLCLVCSKYHNLLEKCPEKNHIYQPKWQHSQGFKSQNYLFNYNYAKKHLLNNKTLILVEGIMDCIKLAEAKIYNCVGLFGCEISKNQINLINQCNINNIVIALDNDEAGVLGTDKIINKLSNNYSCSKIDLKYNDPAELSINELKEIFCLVNKK